MWTDRHLWKHYLLLTVGKNNKLFPEPLVKFTDIITRNYLKTLGVLIYSPKVQHSHLFTIIGSEYFLFVGLLFGHLVYVDHLACVRFSTACYGHQVHLREKQKNQQNHQFLNFFLKNSSTIVCHKFELIYSV